MSISWFFLPKVILLKLPQHDSTQRVAFILEFQVKFNSGGVNYLPYFFPFRNVSHFSLGFEASLQGQN